MKLNIQLFASSKTITKTIKDSYNNSYTVTATINEALPTDYITTNKTSLSGTVKVSNTGDGGAYTSSKSMSATLSFLAENSEGSTLASATGSCKFDFRGSSAVTVTPLTYNNLEISHNADGSRTVYIKLVLKITETSLKQTQTYTDTLPLTTIPRASQPTVSTSSVDMDSSVTITTNRASDSFTHKLSYDFGTLTNQTSGLGASTNVGASTTFTPPLTLANQVPNATSGTCTITCVTYNGSTQTDDYKIGTKTVTLTLNVPSSEVPTVSIGTLAEAGGLVPSSWGVFVQNKSKLDIPITAHASTGSTISSISTTVNGSTYSGSSITTGFLTTSGTNTINTSVKDNRNRTASTSKTFSVVAYNNPLITIAEVKRVNASNVEDDEGTYISYRFIGEISPVQNKNAKTFRIGYRAKGSTGAYTYKNISTNYTVEVNDFTRITDWTFDTNTAYEIAFEAIDSFNTSSNPIRVKRDVNTGFDLLNFNASGKSMAIGTVSSREENEKVLDIELDSYLKKLYLYNSSTSQYEQILPNIGSGTVTSVGITAGEGVSVSGSPITSSGNITVTNTGVRNITTGDSNGTIKANINGSNQNIAVKGLGSAAYTDSTSYVPSNRGVEVIIGTQTSATQNWLGTSTQSALYDGMRILYYLPRKGGLYPKLNLTLSGGNTTGAINVYRYKGDNAFRFQEIYGEKIYVPLTYSSTETAWFMDTEQNPIYTSAICDTIGANTSKVAECTNYSLLSNSYIQVIMANSNTSEDALTLNINETGAKPIYINNVVSSSTNYTLPAGSYLVYYDGTNYYFRTDGKITGDITGNAATATSATTASGAATAGKLQVLNLPSNIGNNFFLPIVTGATGSSFNFYGTDALKTVQLHGTASVEGKSTLYIGNNIATGTAGNKTGSIVLYNDKGKTTTLKTSSSLTTTTLTLPTGTGTIATTGINVSNFTNDAGYTANTGTVTGVTAGTGLNTTSNDTATDGGTISTSGTLYLTKSGVTAGTYQGITVDKYGRVTAAQDKGYTTNTGTITGIKMNGSSKGTSGVVDLGTVITSHQSIKTINNTAMTGTGNVSVQPTLVSGTNIKTINNESLLGSGNITVGGGTTASPNILRASPSANVNVAAKGNTKLTLATNDFQNGSNLSISSGGIKIGSGITKVKVSGTIYYSAGTNAGDSLRCVIYKNDTIVAENYGRAGTTGTYETRSIIPTPITVAQNDIIYLYYNNATAARGTIASSAADTYLVVEQIL